MTIADPQHPEILPPAPSQSHDQINITTLNCWGLLYLSKHRTARLSHIGHLLAHPTPNDPANPKTSTPPVPDIVCLQECWTQQDYLSIRSQTQELLPYGKFYHSGVLGAGLAILSRWPIVESSMHGYPLNGRPTAFFRGDWYVGKGVACARIRVPRDGFAPRSHTDIDSPSADKAPPATHTRSDSPSELIEVFTTHLHAPYEREPHDSYLCHRTAQAYFISKLIRDARERGHLAIACGDFNMLPDSLAYQLVTAHGGVHDIWTHPPHNAGAKTQSQDTTSPTVRARVQTEGCTCDSTGNTWRWPTTRQKTLARRVHRNKPIDEADTKINWDETESPFAKRLDYIFFGAAAAAAAAPVHPSDGVWRVHRKATGLTTRHPALHCSLSDHFAVETTLMRTPSPSLAALPPAAKPSLLPASVYASILDLTDSYVRRERFQRRARIAHFFLSVAVTIGCWIATWWSPRNFVAFLLAVVASLGLMAGTVDGLIGFLFVGSEMACLKEFGWEMRMWKERAEGS